jgi:16S rRNA U516 pseudouridylate synthase RsuA-like enzyme
VKRLIRTRIGGLTLGKLQPGQWRVLDKREVALLKGEDTKRS